MYQLLMLSAAIAIAFTAGLSSAKQPEFVPEKRKVSEKRRPANAQSKKITYEEFPEIMSYHELMLLPPYKRLAYIKAIRAMLVELAAQSRAGGGTLIVEEGLESLMHPEKVVESESRYAFLLSIFDQIIPRANAVTSYDVRFDGINGRHCSEPNETTETMVTVAGDKICFNKIRYANWTRKTPDSNGVLERGYQIRRQTRLDEKRAELRDTQSFQESFDPSQRQAPASDQARLAEMKDVLKQKTEQVEVERQEEQKRGFQLQAQRQQLSNNPAYNQSFDKDKRPAPASDQTRTAEMKDYLGRQTQKVDEDDLSARNENLRNARPFSNEPEAVAANTPDNKGNPGIAGADKEAAPAPADPPKAEPKGDKAMTDAKPASSTPEASVPEHRDYDKMCKTTLLKCEANAEGKYDGKEGYLTDFRKANKNQCISSGNMSSYIGKVVKAKNCALISKFCFNQEKCDQEHQAGATRKEREAGSKDKEKDKDEAGYECKGKDKGKVICNPLVFGLKSEKDPICIDPAGANLTWRCDEAAKKLEGKKGYIANLLDVKKNGVANAWDDWRDQFNLLCRQNTASQSAHCQECVIIANRLKIAMKMATGSCDAAKAYSERTPAAPVSEGVK